MIRHVLPKSEKIDALFSDITEYLEERLFTLEEHTRGETITRVR